MPGNDSSRQGRWILKTSKRALGAFCVLLTGLALRADEARDRFNFATGLFIKNEHELAAEEFEKLLKEFPDFPEADVALYRMGEALWKLKKGDRAAQAFEQLTTRFPQSERCPQAYYRLGEILSERDAARAAAAYGMVFARWPEHKLAEAALYWSGEEYFRAEQFDEAAKAYRTVLDRFGGGKYAPFSLYSLGWTEHKRGRYVEAAALFRDFLQKFPNHELVNSCRLKLAESLHKLKQYKEAMELFRQVAQADATLAPDATLGLAWALYEGGDRNSAAGAFLGAADLLAGKPQAAACLFNAGNALVEVGAFDRAREAFARLVREWPEHELAPEASYWIGYCLVREKRWDAALDTLQKLETSGRLKTRQVELIQTIAEARFGRGDFVGAAARYGEVLTKFPQHEMADEAAYGRMLALERAGETQQAVRAGEEFLKQFPQSPLVHLVKFAVAEYRFRQGNMEEAAAGFREFLAGKEHGDLADDAEYKLGWCALNLKKPAEAIQHFMEVATRYAESPLAAESVYSAGKVAHDMGDSTRARELYRQCVASYPQSEYARRSQLGLILLDLDGGRAEEARKGAVEYLAAESSGPLADFARVYLGGALFELGRYDEALAAYGDVKNDPVAMAEASYGRAWVYRKKGDHRQAAEIFGTTAKMKSVKAEDAAFWRCRSLEDAGDFDTALKAYDDFLAAYPTSKHTDEADYRGAVCLSRAGRARDAWIRYENFVKSRPKSELADNALYDMAWMRKNAMDTTAAAQLFERLLREYPGSELAADVEFRLGELAQTAKEYKRAVEYFRKVLARPGVQFADKVLYRLAWCHRELGEGAEACEAFRRIYLEYPKSELGDEARYRVGMCFQEQKKYMEAVELYRKVEKGDFRERAAFQEAECLRLLERYPEALKAYEAFLKEFGSGPYAPHANLGRGHCYRALGAWDDAIDAYRAVTRATETIEAAMAEMGIGHCLFAKRQHNEAIKSFLKVDILYGYEELKPEALSMVVKCWRELNDAEKAEKYRSELRTRYPDSPYARE